MVGLQSTFYILSGDWTELYSVLDLHRVGDLCTVALAMALFHKEENVFNLFYNVTLMLKVLLSTDSVVICKS